MPEKGDVDAEAGRQGFLYIRFADSFCVFQQPKIGDAGVIDIALKREDAGADARSGVTETIGEDSGLVRNARALGVLQERNTIVFGLIGRELVFEEFFVHGHAIGHGPAGEIVVQPVHVIAIIRYAVVEAKRLSHVAASPVVETKADRVRQQWLGGPNAALDALGHAKALHRLGRFLGSRLDFRRVRLGLIPRQESGQDDAGRQTDKCQS